MNKLNINGIMVDIETLGTDPEESPILSIGLVVFDVNEPMISLEHSINNGKCQYIELNIDKDCPFPKIDYDTVAFWIKNAKHFPNGDKYEYQEALIRVMNFIDMKMNKDSTIWSKSPEFDLRFIETQFKELIDGDIPWTFRQRRDVRTLDEIAKLIGVKQNQNSHNALKDAWNQADFVCRVYQKLAEMEYLDKQIANIPETQVKTFFPKYGCFRKAGRDE